VTARGDAQDELRLLGDVQGVALAGAPGGVDLDSETEVPAFGDPLPCRRRAASGEGGRERREL